MVDVERPLFKARYFRIGSSAVLQSIGSGHSSVRRLDKPPLLAVVSLGKTDEPQRAAARTMAQGRRRIAKARVDRLLTTEAAARSNPTRGSLMAASARLRSS